MNRPTSAERRIKERIPLLVQVDWEWQEAFSLGKSQDVSESGLLILSPETLAPHTEVTVRFTLPVPPQAVTVEARGKVAWSRTGACMGIEFVDLKDEYRQAIARYVELEGGNPS